MTPGRTTGPGFVPAGSRESGIVSAGAVGFPIAVTLCPSANIGEATATAGAVGAIAGSTAEGGVAEGLEGVPVGLLGGKGSDIDGGVAGGAVIGADGGATGGAVFGFVATAGGSGALSPVKGANQSASCSGSMAR